MAHLLDSDIVIDYLGGNAQTRRFVDPLIATGVFISMVTYMGVLEGVLARSDPVTGRRDLDAFLARVPTLPFSTAVAERCARLRADLKRQGRRIRPRALDLITAATALQFGLTLVTRNRGDYEDIPGLPLS